MGVVSGVCVRFCTSISVRTRSTRRPSDFRLVFCFFVFFAFYKIRLMVLTASQGGFRGQDGGSGLFDWSIYRSAGVDLKLLCEVFDR